MSEYQPLTYLSDPNYLLEYRYNTKSERATLIRHWNGMEESCVYDTEENVLRGNLFPDGLKCPIYYVPGLINHKIRQYCEEKGFPLDRVRYMYNDEQKPTMIYPFAENFQEAAEGHRFDKILRETENYGLQKDSVPLLRPAELELIFETVFKIKIKVQEPTDVKSG